MFSILLQSVTGSLMRFFTSHRERRLWFWTIGVVLAIYSTLGVAPVLVGALRERNLLRVAFAVVVCLVVGLFVRQWIKERPGWREVGVALAVAFAYWLAFIRIENPGERTHLFEYGVVAALMHQALLERVRNGGAVPKPAALAVLATAVLGLTDELIQAVLPNRVFAWVDVGFNALAGFMVVVARLALDPVRRPGWRLWFLWFMAGAVAWGWCTDPSLFGRPEPFELLPSFSPVDLPRFLNVWTGAIAVGVLHWLVLRRYLANASHWLLASAGAVTIGVLLAIGVGEVNAQTARIAVILSHGAIVGTFQWLVLRRHVAHSGWWILVATLAWLIAIPAGDAGGPPGWSAYPAITGAFLVWLLRNSEHKDPESSSARFV